MVLAPALLRADTAGDWAKANAFYQQKNYDSAAVYYEKIAAGKPRQAAVFYNLGNTYYRLNRIGSQLSFVEIEQGPDGETPAPPRSEVLDRLSRGELSVAQALEQLKQK